MTRIEPDTFAFPLEDTLHDGTYRASEVLRGSGDDKLYLGTRAHDPGRRYLISVTAQHDLPLERLRPAYLQHVPGVFDVEHVGNFDQLGVDRLRDVLRRDHYAMVEALPDGDPLTRVVGAAMLPRLAVELAIAVADVALQAAGVGVFLGGLRPDYIWVRRHDERLVVTGIGSRNHALFACARPRSMVTLPLFSTTYTSPEQMRGEAMTPATPVFAIATMLVEWITGTFPFANRDAIRAATPSLTGVPAALEPVLARCFVAQPELRFSLDRLVNALAQLAL